jgi:hypothetical protein
MRTTSQRAKPFVLPTLLFLIVWSPLFSQEEEQAVKSKKSSIFELFLSDDYTEFNLTFNFQELERLKNTNDYMPAAIELDIPHEEVRHWDIEIKARGRYRRRICDFPPIKLKFDKNDLAEVGYKKDNDMKLVTHCIEDYTGKENVLREYLTYKLYEFYSDQYFRTQLVKVNYFDSESRKKMKGIGILIEDNETVERRLKGKICEDCYSIDHDSFYMDNLHITALFQYMVGNADWSVPMVRNIEMMKGGKEDKYFMVPYDFDFSGLVNASYAVPNTNYNQKSIRDRVYLAPCEDIDEIKPYAEYFKSKKEEVIGFVKSFKKLSAYSRRDIVGYLESFYDGLENGSFYNSLLSKK